MNNICVAKIGNTSLKIAQDNIIHQTTSIIVNAANSRLQPGGGVDGAIHAAAGSSILAELRKAYSGCPPGEVVITNAGNLSRFGVKKIFHTVGPIWNGGNLDEQRILAACYSTCLQKAFQNSLFTITFPSISTGVYGYPIEKAVKIALKTVLECISESFHDIFEEIIFVLFSENDFNIYKKILEELLDSGQFKNLKIVED